MFIKKIEEINKYNSSSQNIFIVLDISIKEISNEENQINSFSSKFNNALSNYKNVYQKLIQQKEKVYAQISSIKDNLQKDSEDVNNFTKYESKLTNLRTEEYTITEQINELNKKYKKSVEDFLENIRKNVILQYREKDPSDLVNILKKICLTQLNKLKRFIYI